MSTNIDNGSFEMDEDSSEVTPLSTGHDQAKK